MKALTSVLTATAFSLLVVAHGGDNLDARGRYARQASSSPNTNSHSGSTTSSSVPSTGPIPSNSVNPSVTANPSSTPSIAFTLLSTNPTAVPLASIVSNQSSLPIPTLTTTESPGPGPSGIPSAPLLPDIAKLNPALYPKLDVTPPIDSPEVQQWIQDVKDTGIEIPGFLPTNPGGCANNTLITNPSDPDRCWWTCGGCTKKFDVVDCVDPLTWGLTYDDGPAFYTQNLLTYLEQQKLKSTFFVVGSRIISFPRTLQEEYMSGHQIAVHTWSHPAMTTLSNEEVIAELGWTKKVIKDVLGVTPNTWRPPYGDIDNRVRAIGAAMGLTPVIWSRNSQTGVTYDTGDFNIKGGLITVQQVLQNWQNIIGNATQKGSGFIVLEHDLFEQSVEVATGYILPDAIAHNFIIQPVIACQKMPMANAYIETNDNSSNPPPILNPSFVTTTHVPSSTGGSGSSSSSDARFSVGFSLMFIMTIVTLLAGVYAGRF